MMLHPQILLCAPPRSKDLLLHNPTPALHRRLAPLIRQHRQHGPHSHFLICLPNMLCGCFFFLTQDAIKHHVWIWWLCLPHTISHDSRSFEESRPDVLQNVPRDSHVSLRPNVSSKGSSCRQPISPRPRPGPMLHEEGECQASQASKHAPFGG